MEYGGCVYIMTNFHHTVLYIGVTSNLPQRVYQHKTKELKTSFTANNLLFIDLLNEVFEDVVKRDEVNELRWLFLKNHFQRTGGRLYLARAHATGVRGADERTCRRPDHDVGFDACFLERSNHARVGKASKASAAKNERDAGSRGTSI